MKNCTYTVKSKERKRKSWITHGLINSINEIDKMYQTLRTKYNHDYKNRLNFIIKKAKSDFYKQKIFEKANNNKAMWHTMQEITSGKQNDPSIKQMKKMVILSVME